MQPFHTPCICTDTFPLSPHTYTHHVLCAVRPPLQVSVPMLLTLGHTGLPYSGADVGGFFGNPDAQLMTGGWWVATHTSFRSDEVCTFRRLQRDGWGARAGWGPCGRLRSTLGCGTVARWV